MKVNENTVSLLLDVGKIIRSRMERELPISFGQCKALDFLSGVKDMSMRTIAEHFKITAPSATAIVNDLVEAGLVERTENAKDRREVLLRVTSDGKKILQSATAAKKKVVVEILSVLSEHDRAELDLILSKIVSGAETN